MNHLLERKYFIEDVFETFTEYQQYLTKALASFQDQIKKRNPTWKKYVPEYLQIEFDGSIKAPRLYFPRYTGILVLQMPSNKTGPRKRALIREQMLQRFAGIVKINELAVADEIAMRMKIIAHGKRRHPKPRQNSEA